MFIASRWKLRLRRKTLNLKGVTQFALPRVASRHTTVTLQDLRDLIAVVYPETEDIAVATLIITVAGKPGKEFIRN